VICTGCAFATNATASCEQQVRTISECKCDYYSRLKWNRVCDPCILVMSATRTLHSQNVYLFASLVHQFPHSISIIIMHFIVISTDNNHLCRYLWNTVYIASIVSILSPFLSHTTTKTVYPSTLSLFNSPFRYFSGLDFFSPLKEYENHIFRRGKMALKKM